MGYWRNSSLFSIHFCIYLSFDGNVPFLHPNINVKRLLGEQEMLKIYYNWMGWVSKDDLISYVKSHESPTEKKPQCQLPLMVIWHFLMWITCVVITRWITCICHYSLLINTDYRKIFLEYKIQRLTNTNLTVIFRFL